MLTFAHENNTKNTDGERHVFAVGSEGTFPSASGWEQSYLSLKLLFILKVTVK